MRDDLGNRMKSYEAVYDFTLPQKSFVVARLDGKAFHTFTRSLEPFNDHLNETFINVCYYLAKEVQNNVLIYHQSDEISILLTDDILPETSPYFGNRLQKLCSILASMTTAYFNSFYWEQGCIYKPALFDCRLFVVPQVDVPNYFVWRMKDNDRNVIMRLAQNIYSHKDLQGISCKQLLERVDFNLAYNFLDDTYRYGNLVVGNQLHHNKFNYEAIESMIDYILQDRRTK